MDWKTLVVYCIILFTQICFSSGAKPELVSSTTKLTKVVGSNIMMSCKFKSSTAVAISWLKDGKAIVKSDRIYVNIMMKGMESLNVEKITANDGGTYACIATNSDGKTSADIEVDLILDYKPKIHDLPDVYLKEGSKYEVECDSIAIPQNVKYSWKRQGGRIDGRSMVARDNVLEIKTMRKRDVGRYACTATNAKGTSEQYFNLKIADRTQWIEKPKDKVISTTDNKFEWVASIATLSENPVFKWYKDGSDILRSSTMTRQGAKFTSRLKFPDLNLGDAGNYKVTVEKLDFGGFQSVMKLNVFAPPSVQIHEGAEVKLHVGDPLSLTCTAQANPPPSIEWYFNGKIELSLEANGTKTLTLFKSEVSKEDRGVYTCNSVNEKGNGTVSINVIIETRGLTVALKITVVVIVCCLLVLLIAGGIFFYLKYGERCIKAGLDEVAFYTDLVEEEKDLSSLAEIENNPNTLKKNINMSIRRRDIVTDDPNARKGSIFSTIRALSVKRKPEGSFERKQSIFDTIRTNPGNNFNRQGSVLQTIRTMSVKGRSPSLTDNQFAHLGSIALCQGKAIDLNELTFEEVIAEGEYGGVTKGQLVADDDDETYKEVAIKMFRDDKVKASEKRNMLSEIRLMRRISSHANIVEFIGWCNTPTNVYIIEEYLPFGNLLTFLRAQRHLRGVYVSEDAGDVHVDQNILLSYAKQIAAGMMHLAQLQVCHRDLACRNVYISYENTVKISDYAIVRDIYTPNVYRQTTGGQLPVRWMAYEAIFNGIYSIKSDVWSFGVLLWELTTLGRIPYPGIMRTEQLLEELEGGYHMENPGHISTDLYLLMDSCWNKKPESRPSFNSLYAQVVEYINDINDAEESVLHIDLAKFHHTEKESMSSDDFLSPTEDCHRPPVFPSVVEEDEEELEDEEEDDETGQGEADPLSLSV